MGPIEETEENSRGPSKSRRKRDMLDLQALGVALLDLPPAEFEALDISARLRDALQALRGMNARGARKRQMQFVGKLMRDEDPAPLADALDAYRRGRRAEADTFHEAETWRERLLEGDAAVTEWLRAYPDSDTPAFRKLLNNARNEAERARDGLTTKRPFYRALFRSLRDTQANNGADRDA